MQEQKEPKMHLDSFDNAGWASARTSAPNLAISSGFKEAYFWCHGNLG